MCFLISCVVGIGAACGNDGGAGAHHEGGVERIVQQVNIGAERLEGIFVGYGFFAAQTVDHAVVSGTGGNVLALDGKSVCCGGE